MFYDAKGDVVWKQGRDRDGFKGIVVLGFYHERENKEVRENSEKRSHKIFIKLSGDAVWTQGIVRSGFKGMVVLGYYLGWENEEVNMNSEKGSHKIAIKWSRRCSMML